MGLYVTAAPRVPGQDINVTPFTTKVSATLSGGTTLGVATVELTELPNAFPLPQWDLFNLGIFNLGAHWKLWQDEAGLIAFRFFGGLLRDAYELAGDDDSKFVLKYRAEIQSYDGAGLDSCAVGQPGFTIPAGTLAQQVQYAGGQFWRGAALQIDWVSGVENMTGSHQFPALPVKDSTARQVMRALAARAVRQDNTLVPRFCIDTWRTSTSTEFGPPVFYFYNARPANPAIELEYADVAAPGQFSTIGVVERGIIGRPPFITRQIGSNMGGYYAVATGASARTYPNWLNVNGTYDDVALYLANPDADMVAEMGRRVALNGTPREQLRFDSYGRCRPGQWARLYNRKLHSGYRLGKPVVITDVALEWSEKAQDATIDEVSIGNPVLLRITASDRAPELGDNPLSGPDMAQVLATSPAAVGRNDVQATQPNVDQQRNLDSTGTPQSNIDNQGYSHPLHMAWFFKAADATGVDQICPAPGHFKTVLLTNQAATVSFNKNGNPVTVPFDFVTRDVVTCIVSDMGGAARLTVSLTEANV